MLIGAVFDEIEKLHGEEVARKIFAPYGRQLTPREKNLIADANLLCRYLYMPKRNAHELARTLVREGRSPTFEAALVWVKRVAGSKNGLVAAQCRAGCAQYYCVSATANIVERVGEHD